MNFFIKIFYFLLKIILIYVTLRKTIVIFNKKADQYRKDNNEKTISKR